MMQNREEPTTQYREEPTTPSHLNVPAQRRRFVFTVDKTGTFSWGEPETWLYNEEDEVEFVSRSGQFTIDFRRVQAPSDPAFNPLQGPLTALMQGDEWVAGTKVVSGMTRAARAAAWRGQGFVASYVYVVDANVPDAGKFHAENHNGVFGC